MNGIKSTGKGKTGKTFGVKRARRESRDVILGITKHPLEDWQEEVVSKE